MGGTMKLIDESEFYGQMPIAKPRSFICLATSECCKYTGCSRQLCLRQAAKGDNKSIKAAEDALRAYQAATIPNDAEPQGCGRHSKRRALSARTRMLSANRSAALACGVRGSSAMLCRSQNWQSISKGDLLRGLSLSHRSASDLISGLHPPQLVVRLGRTEIDPFCTKQLDLKCREKSRH